MNVRIYDRETGKIHESKDRFPTVEYIHPNDGPSETWDWFWWVYGNGSCDCNRGVECDGDLDAPCQEVRYLVLASDGKVSGEYNEHYTPMPGDPEWEPPTC